jgi:hypothetical protein
MTTDHVVYVATPSDSERGSYGSGAARVVLWLFLLAALGFFIPFAWMVDVGIMQAANTPAPDRPPVDSGGIGWLLQTVVGVVVLGIALAGAAAWTATRNRAKDPITEAATAKIYDAPDRRTADDDPDRAPADRPEAVKQGLRTPDA